MAFQPGQSGNPGGRPKTDKFLTQHLLAELKTIDPVTEANRARKVIQAIVTKAEEGDVAAFNAIMDRVEGKVATVLAGDEDNPIRHERIVRIIVEDPRLGDTDSPRLLTSN